jgi:prepilin-type N-terminal cleavage/methylation domain-containing protein
LFITHHYRARAGFTLVELLVVIAIIGILAAILFPVFARVRESAHTTVCLSNTKQIGAAMLLYSQDYDEALVPWANCAPYSKGYVQACSVEASAASLWTDTLQPYLKNRQVLLCSSFQATGTAQAMDAATCDGNGTAGSASAGVLPADVYFSHYGLAYPLVLFPGCDTTGSQPYARYPGSGWIIDDNNNYNFQLQTQSGVVDVARTALLGDGLTYQSHNSSGPFVGTLYGCEGRGRHNGGVVLTFADSHSKWVSNDPEQHLAKDEAGCYYEKYYTSDK